MSKEHHLLHPEHSTLRNDIALLKMIDSIEYNGKIWIVKNTSENNTCKIISEHIQPISLQNIMSNQDLNGLSAIASGFGYYDSGKL